MPNTKTSSGQLGLEAVLNYNKSMKAFHLKLKDKFMNTFAY
jgi:hypothetical protein